MNTNLLALRFAAHTAAIILVRSYGFGKNGEQVFERITTVDQVGNSATGQDNRNCPQTFLLSHGPNQLDSHPFLASIDLSPTNNRTKSVSNFSIASNPVARLFTDISVRFGALDVAPSDDLVHHQQ